MIKEFVKKYLPARWWRVLFLGRKYLHQSRRFHPETGAIRDLAAFARSVFRNTVPLTAKLDYSGRDIRVAVDSPVSLMRSHACHKEPETVAWIETGLRDGGVFYDIGANIGAYSLVADAASGGQAMIFAFEPEAGSYALLIKNIRLNGANGRIVPFCLAVSGKSELMQVVLSAPEAGSADHRLYEVNDLAASVGDGVVPAMSLDAILDAFGLPAPNMVKIDVDGGEGGVVAGMNRVLQNQELKSILIELDDDLPASRKIRDIIEAAGFRLATKHRRSSGKNLYNYIFSR